MLHRIHSNTLLPNHYWSFHKEENSLHLLIHYCFIYFDTYYELFAVEIIKSNAMNVASNHSISFMVILCTNLMLNLVSFLTSSIILKHLLSPSMLLIAENIIIWSNICVWIMERFSNWRANSPKHSHIWNSLNFDLKLIRMRN